VEEAREYAFVSNFSWIILIAAVVALLASVFIAHRRRRNENDNDVDGEEESVRSIAEEFAQEARENFDQFYETMDSKTYVISVAGESFDNPDGTSRQKIIKSMRIADPVTLIREPENPYDLNAIAVHHASGQIGYVSKENAKWLAEVIDGGREVRAFVLSMESAETERGPLLGVVLRIFFD